MTHSTPPTNHNAPIADATTTVGRRPRRRKRRAAGTSTNGVETAWLVAITRLTMHAGVQRKQWLPSQIRLPDDRDVPSTEGTGALAWQRIQCDVTASTNPLL